MTDAASAIPWSQVSSNHLNQMSHRGRSVRKWVINRLLIKFNFWIIFIFKLKIDYTVKVYRELDFYDLVGFEKEKLKKTLVHDQHCKSFYIYWRVSLKWINNMVNWNQERFRKKNQGSATFLLLERDMRVWETHPADDWWPRGLAARGRFQ